MQNVTLAEFLGQELFERGGPRKLALALGISPSTVGGWLRGTQPDLEQCFKLAAHFGKRPVKILTMAGHQESLIRLIASYTGDKTPVKPALEEVFPDRSHCELHEWLQELLEAGIYEPTKEALEQFHVPLIQCRHRLLELMERAKARVIVALVDNQVILDTGAAAEELEAMIGGQEVKGWRRFAKTGRFMKPVAVYLDANRVTKQMAEDIIPMYLEMVGGTLLHFAKR